MTTTLHRAGALMALAFVGALSTARTAAPHETAPTPAETREALRGYAASLDEYVRLRRALEWWVLPDEGVAGERVGSVEILAMRIRAARHDARRGDVFTPAAMRVIADRIEKAFEQDLEEGDEPLPLATAATPVRAKVNGALPASLGERRWVSLIPELPPLPAELEYRFVGRDLVLIDAAPNVVVDVYRNAFAPRMHRRP